MTMTWKDFPVRANAFCLSSDRRANSAAMFPADTPCFDILSPPPGETDVINQVERLSSNETKIASRLVRIAVDGFRREVQPRRQHWFLNEKSGFPFRTPAFC